MDGIEQPDIDAFSLWYVPENGYRWFQKDGDDGGDGDDKPWYLMPNGSPAASEQFEASVAKERAYSVFRRMTLLRDFDELASRVVKLLGPANASAVKDLIKAFADQYGWLGVGGSQGSELFVEPLSAWLLKLLEWHDLRTTWKAIKTIRNPEAFGRQDDHEKRQRRAKEALEYLVEWSPNRTEIRYHQFSAMPVASQWVLIASATRRSMGNTRHLPERFNKPDSVSDPGLIEPAEYYVTDEVNKVVRDTVRYGLLHFEKKARLHPTCLVGCLYFQFLTELEGSLARPRRCGFQRCEAKVFTPMRRGQKFCNQRCQQSEWRRKDRATKKEAKNA